MKFPTRLVLGLAAASLIAAMTATSARAAGGNDGDGRVCGNSTLRGTYGLHATGVRLATTTPPQSEMHATLALRTYDGNGQVTSQSIASQGSISGVQQGREITGTYQVNANCTGTVKLNIPGRPVPIEASFIIVNKGRQIKEVPTSPGDISVALLERQ